MRPRRVTVNDLMQRGYSYVLTEPPGRKLDPLFRPELTPKQLLHLGVFGGKYMTDCRAEFPASWFARAKLSPDYHDPKLNFEFEPRGIAGRAYWNALRPLHALVLRSLAAGIVRAAETR